MRISVSRVLCGADSGNNHKAYHREVSADIDGLWLLQIGEPVGVGFLRAVVEPYVVTSGEGTPQPEPDGRAENRAVVTEGVVFSVFAVGIRPRRQGGDEIGVDGPPDGCGLPVRRPWSLLRRFAGLRPEIVHHGFGAAAPKGFDDFDAVPERAAVPGICERRAGRCLRR